METQFPQRRLITARRERESRQLCSGEAQHAAGAQIGLLDRVLGVKCEVADGYEVVQFDVAIVDCPQLVPCLTEFVVFDLKSLTSISSSSAGIFEMSRPSRRIFRRDDLRGSSDKRSSLAGLAISESQDACQW